MKDERRKLKLKAVLVFFSYFIVHTSSFAQETYFHAGVGAASGSNFGMPITAGAALQAGEIPLTILKTELMAGAWRISDNSSSIGFCDKCDFADAWWGFYQGARLRVEGLLPEAGTFPSTQGVGLAFGQSIPHLEDGGYGGTDYYLLGMGFIRYDLNPGKPAGLFVELDVWLKLTNRESQGSPAEMLTANLGVRLPGLGKR